jgi:hypothetical protein
MHNHCSQEKTTSTPKNLIAYVGNRHHLICKFSHLSGKEVMQKVTMAWKQIPIEGIEPAPKNQTCMNVRCKEKNPAVKNYRAGPQDIDESKWWYFCQLQCMILHLFATKKQTWEALVTGKELTKEDQAKSMEDEVSAFLAE